MNNISFHVNNEYPNPFILERADPHIYLGPDKYYYFTASYPKRGDNDAEGYDRIILRRARTIRELDTAPELVIWRPGETTISHPFIWAPELHCVEGKWYVFYTGSGQVDNHWDINCNVLQCTGDNPYSTDWVELGRVRTLPEDKFSFTGFSLDMTYFQVEDKGYVVWAQHNEEKISCLYIGQVKPEKPYELISGPVLLSKPEKAWECIRYRVNEGPAVLQTEDTIYLFFSASGTGPEYCMGYLSMEKGGNPLDINAWTKCENPVLTSEMLADEYGPGHNSFVRDDATGDILCVYHARSKDCFLGQCGFADSDPLGDPCRHARILKIDLG